MKFFILLTLIFSYSINAKVNRKMANYHTGETEGVFSHIKDAKNQPVIILIHEWWGLNKQIGDTAKRFNKLGYATLEVDLYNGESTSDRKQARKLATRVRNNIPEAMANLRSALKYLKSYEGIVDTKRIAVVGWCFGGGWSLKMAQNDMGVKASVIFYGHFNPKDDLSKMKAKIIGHFGKKDTGIKVETVKELQIQLKTHSRDHQIFIYPNSGHAFFNANSKNYNAKDAKLAWKRTTAFLKEYL